MDYFKDLLATFLDLDHGRNLIVYGKVRQLSEFIKNIRDVTIPFFPSRYRYRYLGSGYPIPRPILSTDSIPGCVFGYTVVCTSSPV